MWSYQMIRMNFGGNGFIVFGKFKDFQQKCWKYLEIKKNLVIRNEITKI